MSNSETFSATVTTAFLGAVLGEATPWLIATVAVVFCDLVFGIRRSWLVGEHIRFSKACRDTMGKLITYTAFVLMVCSIDTATGKGWRLEMWGCLFVCFIEGCSIVGNLLKPKGVELDLGQLLTAIVNKLAKIDGKGVFKNADKGREDGA